MLLTDHCEQLTGPEKVFTPLDVFTACQMTTSKLYFIGILGNGPTQSSSLLWSGGKMVNNFPYLAKK